jgi:phage repressor protein C with HTH and peptisase S24 domain
MATKKSGKIWKKIEVPGVTDSTAYCLEITGNSMLPVYREGDVIIVSPKAKVRNGDRVVVKTTDGKVWAKLMRKKSKKAVELASFNPPGKAIKLAMKDVEWMARIVWATQ